VVCAIHSSFGDRLIMICEEESRRMKCHVISAIKEGNMSG